MSLTSAFHSINDAGGRQNGETNKNSKKADFGITSGFITPSLSFGPFGVFSIKHLGDNQSKVGKHKRTSTTLQAPALQRIRKCQDSLHKDGAKTWGKNLLSSLGAEVVRNLFGCRGHWSHYVLGTGQAAGRMTAIRSCVGEGVDPWEKNSTIGVRVQRKEYRGVCDFELWVTRKTIFRACRPTAPARVTIGTIASDHRPHALPPGNVLYAEFYLIPFAPTVKESKPVYSASLHQRHADRWISTIISWLTSSALLMPTVHNVAQGAVHMVEDGVNIHKRWFVPVFYRRGDLFNSDAGLGAVRKKRRCLNVVAGGTGIPPLTRDFSVVFANMTYTLLEHSSDSGHQRGNGDAVELLVRVRLCITEGVTDSFPIGHSGAARNIAIRQEDALTRLTGTASQERLCTAFPWRYEVLTTKRHPCHGGPVELMTKLHRGSSPHSGASRKCILAGIRNSHNADPCADDTHFAHIGDSFMNATSIREFSAEVDVLTVKIEHIDVDGLKRNSGGHVHGRIDDPDKTVTDFVTDPTDGEETTKAQ
ncbi:hypothetical protein BJV77DRAFT_963427 [Russula vinacea]|nr:hypothetical protein BJV77DRAFT_963427 [Russula vinacea]